MKAMQLTAPRTALRLTELPLPVPGRGQILLKIRACGVCRTDLHVVDGDLAEGKMPIVPGHEIVGTVSALGPGADRFSLGTRVGVPWLGYTCGRCAFCANARENLCDDARFTGYHRDGGYAEYVVADQRYCFPIPAQYSDVAAAPLLCAGLIGYRALAMAGEAKRIGIYGFGAAAHIVAQIACYQGRQVFAFTRPGDTAAQDFARELGAQWAGESTASPPEQLDAALIFAPVGALLPVALRATVKGGTVVCAGIHMSDIPAFPYAILWGERTVRSVANLTRRDGEAFFDLAPRVPVRTATETFALHAANDALERLRAGAISGAAVLVP